MEDKNATACATPLKLPLLLPGPGPPAPLLLTFALVLAAVSDAGAGEDVASETKGKEAAGLSSFLSSAPSTTEVSTTVAGRH